MYTLEELKEIGTKLVEINLGRVSTKSIVQDFKNRHSWSLGLLSNKTKDGKLFKEICESGHWIQCKKEPILDDLEKPLTHQPRPKWAKILISNSSKSVVITCEETHAVGKFMPTTVQIE